ncbi:MAG: DUF429 domain-containing protein [Armatimonadaceae bacterium]
MRYIGLDLAWGKRNTSAAVVLEGDTGGSGAAYRAMEDALTDDDSILRFMDQWDNGGGLLIAIDAPTLVPNDTGRRPCEDELSRRMHRYEAGPHPANRTLLGGPDGTIRGERLVAALAERSITHTPFLADAGNPTRAVFEVFPHPCHIGLFGLEKTLKYKAKPKRPRELRLAEFRRYAALLESLQSADPPLRLPDSPDFWLRQNPEPMKTATLKRYEDALDALTCAYVALYHHHWYQPQNGQEEPGQRTEIIGDLEKGYILIVPPAPQE